MPRYNSTILQSEAQYDVKLKAPRQTVCNIPTDNPKDPYCGGKLKRISDLEPAVKKDAGPGKDVFRCQRCKTLYIDESPYALAKGR